jgi:hypothetical protein
MFARLLPRMNKHYGTKIEIVDGNNSTEIVIHSCNIGEGKYAIPSVRELEYAGITLAQYNANAEVTRIGVYGDSIFDCYAREFIDPGHFENQWDFEMALLIMDAINTNKRN